MTTKNARRADWSRKASGDARFRAGLYARALFGDVAATDWCETNDLRLVRAAAGESPNSAGGFLVPEEIEVEIFAARARSGIIRRVARVREMGADTRSFPRQSAALVAGFTHEHVEIAEQNLNLGTVTASGRKVAILLRSSTELFDDEIADLGAWFVEETGAALALLEDQCAFLGDSSETYGGMTGLTTKLLDAEHTAGRVVAAAGHDTFAELDATDLGDVQALLPEQYWDRARWYCSAFAAVKGFIRLGATVYDTIQTPEGPRPLLEYHGWPIELIPGLAGSGDQSGVAMVIAGDLKMATLLASRRGLYVRASNHRYLEHDQIALLATARFHVVNDNLGDNTAAGAAVALVGE